MITLIQGSWLVGFDGKEHRLISNGELAFDDDRIIYIGKKYRGEFDKKINGKGKLVSPGFINIHALTSICITHFRIDGVLVGGKLPNKAQLMKNLTKPVPHLEGKDLETSALFSIVGIIKGGATTFGEITAFGTTGFQPPLEQAEEFVNVASKLGARAYISHPHTDMKKFSNHRGEVEYYHDPEAGLKALDDAVKFCKRHEGTHNNRIKTMLFPYMFDACST
jgi:cytosine/adenosine deaminase-related metal-dependent hydrolase